MICSRNEFWEYLDLMALDSVGMDYIFILEYLFRPSVENGEVLDNESSLR